MYIDQRTRSNPKVLSKVVEKIIKELQIIHSQRIRLPYSWYKKIAKHTNTIPFDCNFIDNVCKNRRSDKFQANTLIGKKKPTGPEGCCCGGCASNFGHFNILYPGKELAAKYALLYNPKTGFWQEGAGCILPREMRSSTCLGFTCNTVRKQLKKKQLQLLDFIRYDDAATFNNWLKEERKSFTIKTVYDYVSNQRVW